MSEYGCTCNGWDTWRTTPIEFRPSVLPRLYYKERFLICPFCKKPEDTYLGQLVTCPKCNRKFAGYKPYPKIDYECSECEE